MTNDVEQHCKRNRKDIRTLGSHLMRLRQLDVTSSRLLLLSSYFTVISSATVITLRLLRMKALDIVQDVYRSLKVTSSC